MDECLNKLCRETDLKVILVALSAIIIVCFIIDVKIGIAVSIVFLVVFSILLSNTTRECYAPATMNGCSVGYGGSAASGHSQNYLEGQCNNEGASTYETIENQRGCDSSPYVPEPGVNPGNKEYKLRNPDIILGSDNVSQTQYIATKNYYIKDPIVPNLKYTRASDKCTTRKADCLLTASNPSNIPPFVVGEKGYVSANYKIVGPQNPKTKVPPMITRPMYSLDWRKSSMVVPNMINSSTNENLYLSGYLSPEDIPRSRVEDINDETNEDINDVSNSETIENYEDIVENYAVNAPEAVEYDKKTWSDMIDKEYGYSKTQFTESGFPNNLPQGNCGRDPIMKEYNKNLFTQTVQPGVYYRDDIIEPINSNIGISFQQQFLPRTFQEVDNGLLIEDHDPNLAPKLPMVVSTPRPDDANIYDPRFTGYGTSYRNYVDPVTGQPRFPYDDVNAKRMPSYIVRSKIDTHNFADTYDSVQNKGLALNDIRAKAQSAFMDDTTSHRDDIMSKLMRKTNAEAWQRRSAPIHTSSRSVGVRH